MNTARTQFLRPKWALLALCATLGSAYALAANKTDSADALARYRQERAVCMSGQSNQDRATCLREASAALADAKRGALGDGAAQSVGNESKRCERLPDEERKACVARMRGQGRTSGSAAAGGISRELVTREIGVPSTAASGSDAQVVPVK
jgi:hypothetical protein